MKPLLHAIIDDPSDDAARLVYSDWLKEHGQEDRGEFIRVQIELASLEAKDLARGWSSHFKHDDLQRRERDLLDKHGGAWIGPPTIGSIGQATLVSHGATISFAIPGPLGGAVIPCEAGFSRGFIESISLPSSAFTRGAAIQLFSSHPITEVNVTDTLFVYDEIIDDNGRRCGWSWINPESHPWWQLDFSVSPGLYHSQEKARKAMSYALVAMARTAAGLDPLPTPSLSTK